LENFLPFIIIVIIIVIVINSNINIFPFLSIKDWCKKYFVLVLHGYKTVCHCQGSTLIENI